MKPRHLLPRLPESASQVWKGAPHQIKATEATLSKKYNSEVTVSGCDFENSQNVLMVKRVLNIYGELDELPHRTVELASIPVFHTPAFFAAVEKNGESKPGRNHDMSHATNVTRFALARL